MYGQCSDAGGICAPETKTQRRSGPRNTPLSITTGPPGGPIRRGPPGDKNVLSGLTYRDVPDWEPAKSDDAHRFDNKYVIGDPLKLLYQISTNYAPTILTAPAIPSSSRIWNGLVSAIGIPQTTSSNNEPSSANACG